MTNFDVIRVPVLNDNYSWLVHDADSGETMELRGLQGFAEESRSRW